MAGQQFSDVRIPPRSDLRSGPGRFLETCFARPWIVAFAALLVGLLTTFAAVMLVLSAPSLGLTLAADGERVIIRGVDGEGPGAALPVGSHLLSIRGGSGEPVELNAMDIAEEPDAFDSYNLLSEFYARQAAVMEALRDGPIAVAFAAPGGVLQTAEIAPARGSVGDLPAHFWVQCFVGAASLLIGAWIWSLRRFDPGAVLYGAAGISVYVASLSAAIYSSRELALDAGLTRFLSAINHMGAVAFGAVMIAFFLSYPVRTVPMRLLRVLFAISGFWIALDLFWLLPAPVYGVHLAIIVEMALIFLCAGWQYRATRKDPRARALLNWLGLSVMIGGGAFILTVTAPTLFGVPVTVSQGYAFLFFLLIYVGLGVGVARYRLFELEQWAFRVLFYAMGVLLLILLDAVLVLSLSLDRTPAFGIALVAVSLLYLPLRDGLSRRFSKSAPVDVNMLFEAGVEVAFTPPGTERDAQWRGVLQRLFDPLVCEVVDAAPPVPEIRQDGLELAIPAVAGLPALRLVYPWSGRGLFGASHLFTAGQLVGLMQHAEAGRNAYERGALEERRRIAADLHDDVGARLLTGLHQTGLAEVRNIIRAAMADIRTIAVGLAGDRLPAGTVLADLRHETAQRLDHAGIELHWTFEGLKSAHGSAFDYGVYKHLVSCHREIVSNAIRHSGARNLSIAIALSDGGLRLAYEDDGTGFDPDAHVSGSGLANIRRRVDLVGGSVRFARPEDGTGLRIELALPFRGLVP